LTERTLIADRRRPPQRIIRILRLIPLEVKGMIQLTIGVKETRFALAHRQRLAGLIPKGIIAIADLRNPLKVGRAAYLSVSVAWTS
jgi:hypothetical protein